MYRFVIANNIRRGIFRITRRNKTYTRETAKLSRNDIELQNVHAKEEDQKFESIICYSRFLSFISMYFVCRLESVAAAAACYLFYLSQYSPGFSVRGHKCSGQVERSAYI